MLYTALSHLQIELSSSKPFSESFLAYIWIIFTFARTVILY